MYLPVTMFTCENFHCVWYLEASGETFWSQAVSLMLYIDDNWLIEVVKKHMLRLSKLFAKYIIVL